MPEEQRGLDIELLGPLRVRRGEQVLDLGSGRRRAVFAVLAMRAGQTVSRAELIEAVWGDDPPATVEGSLYTYVSDLRRVLEPRRSRWSSGEVLVSAGGGYELRVDPARIDVVRLEHMRERAAQCAAEDRWQEAYRLLSDALALWRGEALADVGGPFVARHRARLAEIRLATVESRAEAALAAGRAEEVVDELRRLVAEHPTRERTRGLLMSALHAGGRSEEALAVYADAERVLAGELGIEPGPALRSVREAIQQDMRSLSPWQDAGLRPSAPAPFVGRAQAMAALRDHLVRLAEGRGGAVWVEGEPGCGKTALLAAALDHAGHACPVVWAAGDELSGRFPLGMLLEAFGVDARSPDPQRRELARELRQRDGARRTGDAERIAIERLLAIVDQLCAHRPLVVVLDDVQWADEASLLACHRLVRMTRRAPLLVLAAARPVPRRDAVDRVRAAFGGPVRIPPLDQDEVADLVCALAGAEPSVTLLDVVAGAVGNPRLIHLMIDGLRRAGGLRVDDGLAEVDRDAVPRALGWVSAELTGLLGFLGEPARDVLRWASLFGQEFDLGEVAAATARPVSDLIGPVEEAVAAGVLRDAGDRFAFRHPLVRQALHEAMPKAVRVALHRQAARTLAAAGSDPDRVAQQLLAAPVEPDAWTIDWLLQHSDTVARRSPELAADLLERAVRVVVADERTREVLTARLARLRFWLGRRADAEARAVLAMTTDAGTAAEMRLLLAYLDAVRGVPGQACLTLRSAADDADVPPRWRAQQRMLLASIERPGCEDLADAENDARAMLQHAGADPLDTVHALRRLWQVESARGRHRQALHHVDAALAAVRDHPDLVDVHVSLLDDRVATLHALDRFDEADRCMAEARQLIVRRDGRGSAGLPVPAAVHAFWLGRWDQAIVELDAVPQAASEVTLYGLRRRGAIVLRHGMTALIAGLRDDERQLENHLRAAADLPFSVGAEKDHAEFLMAARALAAERRGELEEALAALQPMLELDRPWAARHQWLPAVVRLALRAGRTDLAQDVCEVAEAGKRQEDAPGRATAAATWCHGLLATEPDELAALASRFQQAGRRYEYAMVLADAAELFARTGREAEARSALRDSLLVATDLGAAWCVARAEERLRPYGLRRAEVLRRPDAADSLSPLEVTVAELVADGWPDDDVAHRLSLSRQAVRKHVERIQRVLGVTTRLGITRAAVAAHRAAQPSATSPQRSRSTTGRRR
jgi:DNA-binding SARP family transcriptional activator/DNA-binding NarL/FixJ family response regulator